MPARKPGYTPPKRATPPTPKPTRAGSTPPRRVTPAPTTRAGATPPRRVTPGPKPRGGGGINIPKFAGEVSRNFAKGVAHVGKQLDQAPPLKKTRAFKPPNAEQSAKNRAALRKSLGK